MADIDSIVSKIVGKRSLSGLSSEIVEQELASYVKKEKIDMEKLKEKDIKLLVQDIRARLRRMSGSFTAGPTSHKSTDERKDFYPYLNERISLLHPRSVLDLGAGLNPIFMAKRGMEYYAYDVDASAMEKVSRFFKENGIAGHAKPADIMSVREFPKVDLCMIFKVLDLLDEKGHKNAEALIRKIDARYFLLSFPTKTLSGAPMRHPQRGWIERLLGRLGFNFESFSSKNEIFYLSKKGANAG